MKNKAFTLVEMLVCLAIIGALVAMLYPVLSSRPTSHGGRGQCASNLKQTGLAFLQYAQDYDDEKFPLVANASAGYWAGALQPYIKSWQVFQCPSDATSAPKTTDYYYNSRLANVAQKEVDSPNLTIMMGEGQGDQLTLYHLAQLPDAWRKDAKSPANRHLDRANYFFADGHVKPLQAEQVTLQAPAKNQPTFLVK